MNRFVLVVASTVLLAGPPASVSAQTTHLVNLDGIAFIPADLTIAVGDTVHWVWVGGFHDVKSGETGAPAGDGRFSSGDPVFPPMTFDFVFDQAFLDANPVAGNAYPYYCSVHFGLGMTATVTVQSAGGCVDDLDCDDADACNGVETCQAGECVDGTPPNCDDGNTCTDDSCDVNLGCRNSDNNVPCDDGDACTSNDTCLGGVCVGGAGMSCDDANPCTDDSCDSTAGCRNVANDANSCSDGDACTVDECIDGTCFSTLSAGCCGSDADCGDGDSCTDDACVGGGCRHTQNAASCDDGDSCTGNDVCAGGVCGGVPISGCCSTDADCDDDDACSVDTCTESVCVNTPTEDCTPCQDDADCADGDSCTDDACSGGVCTHDHNTVECDDGDPCTGEDVCRVGTCVGIPLEGCCRNADECDDRDPCTTDSCVDNECAQTIIEGCGDDDEEPMTPEPPDTGDGGEDDQDTGAPLPSDEGTDSPRRGLCGILGMAVLLATLLGLGFLRITRVWNVHQHGRIKNGR